MASTRADTKESFPPLFGRQRIAALKAAGTPVDIASQAGNGAAEMLAALIRPHLTPVATPPTGIAKLPLIELPAKPSGPLLAIVLSGDGGWRDLDKTISEKLQSAGVSVVGWDCLRYFWSRKSPEQVARDLGAVIDTFLSRWGGSKVVLVGYSFGADVLPFAYDRLSPETKAHIVVGYSFGADVLPFAYDRLSPETKAHIVQLSLLGFSTVFQKGVQKSPFHHYSAAIDPAAAVIVVGVVEWLPRGRTTKESFPPLFGRDRSGPMKYGCVLGANKGVPSRSSTDRPRSIQLRLFLKKGIPSGFSLR
jgi:hypothetical protein